MARFDGGHITSDGGGLLLRETEWLTGIIGQFATCFSDYRDPDRIEHTVDELVAQRIYALALGYEDLNDHDDLRQDPLFDATDDPIHGHQAGRFSMVTTRIIATCRCTSSAARVCSVPACVPRTSMPRPEALKS